MAGASPGADVADLLDGTPVDAAYFDGRTGELACGDHAFDDEGAGLAECFDARFRHYAARPCLGARSGEHFSWLSYAAFHKMTLRVAGALASRIPTGSPVGISGANGVPWLVAEYACLWAGMHVVPLSEAWNDETTTAIARRMGVKAIFVDAERLPALIRVADRIECLQVVVDLDGTTDDAEGKVGKAALLRLRALAADGVPELQKLAPRGRQDTWTTLHTSGTTGLPKGVVYTHELWKTNMRAYQSPLSVGFSYMPLAYITDRHTVATALWNGGRVGVASLHGVANKEREIFRDLYSVRPTVLKGVPKFWETVHDAAREVRDLELQILGGRCHTLVCGAGALAPNVAEWFATACHVTDGEGSTKPVQFIYGYGSTEAGNLAVNRKILPHVKYKLLPVEGIDLGKDVGEFAVKTGEMMFGGYHQDDAKTKEAFDDEGYYKMGDIVKLTQGTDGAVYVDVIGRVKSSIKLGNGKWVMVESLEDMYRGVPEVGQIFIHGDSAHDRIVAIVDPQPKTAPLTSVQLLAKLQMHAHQAQRPPHEHVAELMLSPEPFSVENGFLNGTGKVNRRALLAAYQARVDEMLEKAADSVEIDGLDPTKGFVEQGGTSLKAAAVAKLYTELGLPLDRAVALLMDGQATLAEAAAQMNKEVRLRRQGTFELNISRDVELEDGDDWSAVTPCRADGVVVTGASGFVGGHVVAELLREGQAESRQVWCILRENTLKGAKKKLQLSTHKLGLEISSSCEVQCLLGDLNQKMLGVADRDLEMLRGRVGTVIHLAAKVDLTASYAAHRTANVVGTREACRLAGALGARLLHVSTTDVMPRAVRAGREEVEVFDLSLTDEEAPDAAHGYARSKWAAERVVVAARDRGLRCSILRLGMVAGHSTSGVCMARDWVPRLLVGIAHCQAFPCTENRHTLPHSLPVDVAAATIIALAQADAALVEGQGISVASCAELMTMGELRRTLSAFGGPYLAMQEVPFAEWIQRVKSDAALSAWPILRWAEGSSEFPVFNSRPLFAPEPGGPRVLAAVASNAACARGLRRGLSATALQAMLRYLFVGLVPSRRSPK